MPILKLQISLYPRMKFVSSLSQIQKHLQRLLTSKDHKIFIPARHGQCTNVPTRITYSAVISTYSFQRRSNPKTVSYQNAVAVELWPAGGHNGLNRKVVAMNRTPHLRPPLPHPQGCRRKRFVFNSPEWYSYPGENVSDSGS
jgi:hypothetical protein